jgi:hypothetical protein
MKDNVNAIIKKLLEEIDSNLTSISNSEEHPTETLLAKALREPIENAFKQATDSEEKKKLYHKLCLKFHPDKLCSNTTDAFAIKLNAIINLEKDDTLKNNLQTIGQKIVT